MKSLRCFALAICFTAVSYGGNFEEARHLYDRTDYSGAVRELKSPQDAESLRLLGQSYFMMADYKKAAEAFERSIAMDSSDSKAFLWLGRAYGRRAETAFPMAAPAYAVKTRTSFEKAVALDSTNIEAVNDLFEYYLDAPGFLGGGVDRAAKLVPLISKQDAAEGNWAEARMAEHNKQFDVAESHFRRAAQLAPHQAGRLLDLAKFLAKRGRYEESDRAFQQAIAVAPNSPKVLYSRADTLVRSNRNLPEACELLKRYLSMNLSPDDPSREDAQKLLRKASGS